jgi:hypothetical protein
VRALEDLEAAPHVPGRFGAVAGGPRGEPDLEHRLAQERMVRSEHRLAERERAPSLL